MIQKKYHFVLSVEGWIPASTEVLGGGGFPFGGGYMDWGNIHNKLTRPNPPVSSYGGCLRTTVGSGGGAVAQSENYWELTKTWEDLGVPPGTIVTKVNAQYSYRWSFRKKVGKVPQSTAEFKGTDTGMGPFELRDSSGTLLGIFSARINSINRTAANLWTGYPQDPNYVRGSQATEYPISETPITWGIAAGAEVNVPSAQQPSNTTIKFRLRNLTPATSGNYNEYVRLKQDRVVIDITYETPATRRIRGTGITR
ncbi:MAG: hypothetical protein QMD65_01980 [Patescibacteria group bacterium]|nr:hypothetical protein [Patescibacteria group bacterium]